MLSAAQIISIVVFVAVMALVVSEKIHRALAALLGAVVLLVIGIIDFNAGMESIDFNTLGVLCGMMMFVAIVKESGLFEFVAIKSAKACKGNPWLIMIAFAVITAVFSAFLDNVTTVLLIGPMTIMLCKTLDINPVPFLLVEIMMSNIGGTATLIGDPPNIMIGSEAGLSFAQFIMVNAPIVVVIMVVLLVIFRFMYGRHLAVDEKNRLNIMELSAEDAIIDKALFHKSVVMIVLVAIAFMLHGVFNLETSVIALTAAAVIILISGRDIEVAIEGIEWGTIGFFLGLFMVVGGMEHTGVIEMLGNAIVDATGGNVVLMMIVILWASAILSSILDNIPFVATMIPIIMVMEASGIDVYPLWWALSLGACLGGNGTLVGASANVVLSGIANKEGYNITKLLCMSTLSFRLRFQPGIVFFQEPNVHQAAGLSVAYPLESDVEGLPRFHQGNAQSLSCGAQILPRRPFDFERVAQRPEHLAGDVALEAPDGLLLGFSVALALSDVILGPLIIRHPGHCDLVKRPVGAPVAPSVQAMAFRFARARQQRGDAA